MKNKAQVSIEFTFAFLMSLLFLILTVNLFCWLNHCFVDRQYYYETTREKATSIEYPGIYEYTPKPLKIFTAGGRN